MLKNTDPDVKTPFVTNSEGLLTRSQWLQRHYDRQYVETIEHSNHPRRKSYLRTGYGPLPTMESTNSFSRTLANNSTENKRSEMGLRTRWILCWSTPRLTTIQFLQLQSSDSCNTARVCSNFNEKRTSYLLVVRSSVDPYKETTLPYYKFVYNVHP